MSTGILLGCFLNLEEMSLSPLLLQLASAIPFLSASCAFQKEEVLPLRLKNSREYFPDRAKCLGILPSSSMMWAMWSMEEREKGYGNGRDKGKKGIKEEGKKIEISKNSEIDSNQQCLQHIHAAASGTGRPQASSGASD